MSNKFRSQQRKKNPRSVASEDPWRVETPFGPPRISHLHFPEGGIRRIRNTLHKLSPSARAEKEILRQKNRYKIPLTERNVDTFVTEQQFTEACYPEKHSNELHVSAWLERLALLPKYRYGSSVAYASGTGNALGNASEKVSVGKCMVLRGYVPVEFKSILGNNVIVLRYGCQAMHNVASLRQDSLVQGNIPSTITTRSPGSHSRDMIPA